MACLPASSARFCRPQACCLPLRCFRAVRPARAFCHTANIKNSVSVNRSFHYRASWLNYTCIAVVAGAAIYSLWHRSAVNALVGFLLMGVVVLMIERIIHTVYVLTSDGRLIISRGRFSRSLSVPVNEIIRMRVIRPGLLGVRYILIEYGAGHETTVQPVNEEAFMREVRDRQERISLNINKDEDKE